MTPGKPRVLVAGVGNLLRGDDGFGVEVVRCLRERVDLPAEARVVDVGIGGIPLVHELLDGYEFLIVVDAVRRGGAPGALVTLRPQLPDFDAREGSAGDLDRHIGDPHTTTPVRVLLLARALGVLPADTVIVGCESAGDGEIHLALSEAVAEAVPRAADRVIALVRAWLAAHRAGSSAASGAPRAPAGPALGSP